MAEKTPKVGVCDYTYDEERMKLRVNCLGCLYGASIEDYEQCMSKTIDKIMEVEYQGGIFGDDSSTSEFTVEGGVFSSESSLSWRPSVGWFAHVFIGILAVLMFVMTFKLDLGERKEEMEPEYYDETYYGLK